MGHFVVHVAVSWLFGTPDLWWFQVVSDLLHLIGCSPYDRKRHERHGNKEKQRRLMYGRVQPGSKRKTLREVETSSVSEWTEDEFEVVMDLEDERNRST